MHFLSLAGYFLLICALAYFAAHRLKMIWLCLHARSKLIQCPSMCGEADVSEVCIQCPIYNEPLVVEGLLEHVTQVRWRPWLEIQILDDSDDRTTELINSWCVEHPVRAKNIRHIRRLSRDGYKAGALKHGLQMTSAKFIAILDADFRPAPDFLEVLIPHFCDPCVGVVQARWDFCNRGRSLLTWLQSIILNVHFVIEQHARSASNLFLNFNGTAGIWRRTALDEGGNWSADTVTEDLDLSYRSQLAGWKVKYILDYAVPSELPETLIAFKSQQRRWTKGGAQVAKRLFWRILGSSLPISVKREALSHLTIGAAHVFLALFCLNLIPYWYFARIALPSQGRIISDLCATVFVVAIPWCSYIVSEIKRPNATYLTLALVAVSAPLVTLFSIGMSFAYSLSFIDGLFGASGEFIRTPKGRAKLGKSLVAKLSGRTFLIIVSLFEAGFAALVLFLTANMPQENYMTMAWVAFPIGISFAIVSAQTIAELIWSR